MQKNVNLIVRRTASVKQWFGARARRGASASAIKDRDRTASPRRRANKIYARTSAKWIASARQLNCPQALKSRGILKPTTRQKIAQIVDRRKPEEPAMTRLPNQHHKPPSIVAKTPERDPAQHQAPQPTPLSRAQMTYPCHQCRVPPRRQAKGI